MNVVRVEYCVEDALRRGLREEAVFQSVMSRINRPGVEADWSGAPRSHPFWMEEMTREASGRKSSRKQIETASNRYIINLWERHLLAKLEAEALDPQVFVDDGEGIESPLGTLIALDEEKGWDVTLAGRVRRTPVDWLLRDLEPMLITVARRVRRALSLEEAHDDDLKQEARIKIADKLVSYEGRCEFKTWAFRVVWRAMVDQGRRLARQRKRERVGLDSWDDEAIDVFEAVDDRLALWPILSEAFLRVPDADLVLLQLLDYKDAEISDDNLRMKRCRARARLAKELQDEPEVLTHLLAVEQAEETPLRCA